MIDGRLYTAPSGAKGFDCNCPVSPEMAALFADDGYSFVTRYVGRERFRDGELTADEVAGIFSAGLAVSVVQHYEHDGWEPTDDKGRRYGQYAADACATIGIPSGVTVWLDLEGVSKPVPAEQTIRYVNYWYDRVGDASYLPGQYVGWNCGLSPDQLYHRLKMARFWGALNLNTDLVPSVRGLCMKQHTCRPIDKPRGCSLDFDTNTVTGDHLGGFPTFFGPPGWGS